MSARLPRFKTIEDVHAWANRTHQPPRIVTPSEIQAREDAEHFALVEWRDLMRGQIPELRYLFHVPNGEFRSPATARKLARMGVVPGVADFLWLLPRGGFHGLTLELKADAGRVSPAQRDFLDFCAVNGYCRHVAHGWMDARNMLLHYYRGEVSRHDTGRSRESYSAW